jgi:hypothetical protein
MHSRSLLCAGIIFLGSAATLSAASPVTGGPSSAAPYKAEFSVSSSTQIPGKNLHPGNYTITLVDHLSDRVILLVESPDKKVHEIFLGVPNSLLFESRLTGPIAWNKDSAQDTALRGFVFPGGGAVEFVYPKDEAVAIAKKDNVKVAAIDPKSEGLHLKNNLLSKDDMQIVTLWLLTPTTVGPKGAAQPAIEAERYKAPPSPRPQPSQELAQNEAPAPPPTVASSQNVPSSSLAPAPHAHRKPVLANLPHTASNLPLILAAGLVSLFLTALLGLVRRPIDEV